MDIVVIGLFGFYGSLTEWIGRSWEGHNVVKVDRKQMGSMPKKADIYFFVDTSEDYSQDIPEDLEGVKACWMMDVQMPGGLERAVNIAKKCDITFCTNYEHGVELLRKFGIDAMWVPYGYDQVISEKVKKFSETMTQDYDVNMVGNPNSQLRLELWSLLQSKYNAVTGRIETEDKFIESMARSKIVVNQPTEPWNNIINLRVWDATACGKFLLCKETSIQEMDILGFRDGVNLVYWQTFEDLVEKIDYYLGNNEEREKIAKQGAILGKKHLMQNQVKIIEQAILSKFYDKLNKNVKKSK